MQSLAKPFSDLARLGQVPIFQGLDQAALVEVLQYSNVCRVQKDCYFFLQGDPADQLYVVIEGRAKLCQMTLNGQKVILKIAGPWQLIGGLAIVGGEVYPVCCMAIEDSIALTWSTGSLAELLKRYPLIAINAARWMGGHVIETQQLFTQIATLRVEQRVARSLLRLIDQIEQNGTDDTHLNLFLTRQDMAEMSGTTLFTVSRILSQWQRDGIIDAGRGRVTVKKPNDLEMIAIAR
jgi:CRP/FNR family transcriptional regulator, nitrogen oxide reductase regulator